MDSETDYEKLIADRMAELPQVVQDAITSADVAKRLRELATTHLLHLDQWESLENEVRMTLLGINDSADLEKNIAKKVGVTAEVAQSLTDDISTVIFEPIREELERQLDHPDAQAKVESDIDRMTAQVLAPPPAPISSAPTAPETKVERAPLSDTYKTGEMSTARKDVHNDPYRETPA